MTAAAKAALTVAVVAAVTDWYAVATDRRRLEYIAKPLTMAALIAVAGALDPTVEMRRTWFVAAGVFSLAGDVFLMLPRDHFVAGLLSFLEAHISYIVGLLVVPVQPGVGLVGALLVALVVAVIGRRVLKAVRRQHRRLFVPVLVYLGVISAMVIAAFATGPVVAIAGAALFFASDSVLALERFVRPTRHGRLAVMVTYHVGQGCLLLSLVTRGPTHP